MIPNNPELVHKVLGKTFEKNKFIFKFSAKLLYYLPIHLTFVISKK